MIRKFLPLSEFKQLRSDREITGKTNNEWVIIMTMVKDLTIEELQSVIKTTVEETMQEFMEEVFASNNHNYLASIEEARADYQAGRVMSFEEAFRV